MMRILILSVLLLNVVYAQNSGTLKVVKAKTKPSSSIKAIGSPSNTLYSFYENFIEVKLPGDLDDYNFRLVPGKVVADRRNGFLLVIPSGPDSAIFQIYNKGDLKHRESPILSQRFLVRETPKPYPIWHGLSEGKVEKWQLDPNAELQIVYADIDYEATQYWYEILSFTFLVEGKEGKQEIQAKGNKLNSSMKAALDKVQAGDRITLNNIEVKLQTYAMFGNLRLTILDMDLPIILEIY